MNTRRLFQSIQSTIQGRYTMKGQRILIGVLVLALLLTLAVVVIQAQEPEPDGEIGVEGQAQEPQPEDEVLMEEVAVAAVSSIVPIQGQLTDSSGNALNGSHNVTAKIYGVSTGGTALCTDADPVTVDNGLFNMSMNGCTASDISGDQLYLGITVGSDPEMTPRQPIYPVPYAWTVKPGAIIKGANSYVFVPGNAFVKNNSNDSTRWAMSGGAAMIYRGATAGSKYIRIPITIPSVLYGQPVRVTHVTVYYKCQNGANNYITYTRLYKHTDADSWQYLVDSSTDRTSNTASSYTLSTDSTYNTLSSSQGILSLYLQLAFANDSEYVQIGGVRLTLDHDY